MLSVKILTHTVHAAHFNEKEYMMGERLHEQYGHLERGHTMNLARKFDALILVKNVSIPVFEY